MKLNIDLLKAHINYLCQESVFMSRKDIIKGYMTISGLAALGAIHGLFYDNVTFCFSIIIYSITVCYLVYIIISTKRPTFMSRLYNDVITGLCLGMNYNLVSFIMLRQINSPWYIWVLCEIILFSIQILVIIFTHKNTKRVCSAASDKQLPKKSHKMLLIGLSVGGSVGGIIAIYMRSIYKNMAQTDMKILAVVFTQILAVFSLTLISNSLMIHYIHYIKSEGYSIDEYYLPLDDYFNKSIK